MRLISRRSPLSSLPLSRSAFFAAALALLAGGCGGGGSTSGSASSSVVYYKSQRLALGSQPYSGKYTFRSVSQDGTVFMADGPDMLGYVSLNDPGKAFTAINAGASGGSISNEGDFLSFAANGDALVKVYDQAGSAVHQGIYSFHRATGTMTAVPDGAAGNLSSTGDIYKSGDASGKPGGCTQFSPVPGGLWAEFSFFPVPSNNSFTEKA